jgi:nitrogen fixation/metabolism regulation signal transduction histidine kinase
MQYKYKRKKKLILPGLQMKLVGAFLAAAGASVLVQSVMLVYALTSLARQAPNDMLIILDRIPGISATILLLTCAIMVVLTVSTGIVVTFRIAGPIYRFEQYLKQVIAGERPADCRLRKGDELLHLCELINLATAPLRTPLEQHDEPSAALPRQVDESATVS